MRDDRADVQVAVGPAVEAAADALREASRRRSSGRASSGSRRLDQAVALVEDSLDAHHRVGAQERDRGLRVLEVDGRGLERFDQDLRQLADVDLEPELERLLRRQPGADAALRLAERSPRAGGAARPRNPRCRRCRSGRPPGPARAGRPNRSRSGRRSRRGASPRRPRGWSPPPREPSGRRRSPLFRGRGSRETVSSSFACSLPGARNGPVGDIESARQESLRAGREGAFCSNRIAARCPTGARAGAESLAEPSGAIWCVLARGTPLAPLSTAGERTPA